MEDASIWQRLQGSILQHPLLATAFLIAIVIIGYGLMVFISSSPEEEVVLEAAQVKEVSAEGEKLVMMIDVSGAVEKPGVYSLPEDSRVKDALSQAGGLRQDADSDRVSRELNLAQKLQDGGKLYIPFKGESGVSLMGGQAVQGAGTAAGLVNINTATVSQLDSLPKVGQVTADKIIAGRPYADVQDLLKKKVVGSAVFNEIQALITVN